MHALVDPFISVIVPAYNESGDIRPTLEALLAQTYPAREIIVVDDASVDDTARIVAEYVDRGIRLIRQPVNGGISAARNAGILNASGEIVVFNDADVCPRPDFLERIASHYRQGADMVLSEACVTNVDRLYSRYQQAQHERAYGRTDALDHTQSFSCRRALAIGVGMFPVTPIPLSAGEDSEFGRRVSKRGRKVIDRSIVVSHRAPSTLQSFWKQQHDRGRGTPLVLFFLRDRRLHGVWLHVLAKTGYVGMQLVTCIPPLIIGTRLARHSRRGLADALPFACAYWMSRLAEIIGVWGGMRDLQVWARTHGSPQCS